VPTVEITGEPTASPTKNLINFCMVDTAFDGQLMIDGYCV